MTSNDTSTSIGGLVFVLFGVVHLAMYAYLRLRHPGAHYLVELRISRLMTGLLVAAGILAFVGVVLASSNQAPELLVYLKATMYGVALPLGILGVAWFWGVGRSLFLVPMKDWKREITRS